LSSWEFTITGHAQQLLNGEEKDAQLSSQKETIGERYLKGWRKSTTSSLVQKRKGWTYPMFAASRQKAKRLRKQKGSARTLRVNSGQHQNACTVV